jgi:hypothetical protein
MVENFTSPLWKPRKPVLLEKYNPSLSFIYFVTIHDSPSTMPYAS